VLEGILKVESELRRQGQELAVAWRRGKARYVLDSLSAETPARSAVLASMIHELLSRWDPLVLRSEGWMTGEELEELTSLYKRKFGMSPPRPEGDRRRDQTSVEFKAMLAEQARLIQEALDAGEPIAKKTAPPPAIQPSPFLRPRRAAL
jgi:hypothetical protein